MTASPGGGRRADGAVALSAELAAAVARLRSAGVASPRADAEQLAAAVLDLPRGRLPLVTGLSQEQAARLRELVDLRARRIPLQHLTGVAGFRRLDLAVGPGVFIPRPETETVVEWAIQALRAERVERPLCVDLCSGSGAIALALADEVPGAVVHAVEAEPEALAWLRRNVERTGLPVTVHAADVGIARRDARGEDARPRAGGAVPSATEALAACAGRVDLVISNPPYLPDDERDLVEPEVGEHDPAAALWGGPDGLDGPRAVFAVARSLLRPGGLLVVEHSDRHGRAAVELLLAAGGWTEVADHPDLAGRDRFVTARRSPDGPTSHPDSHPGRVDEGRHRTGQHQTGQHQTGQHQTGQHQTSQHQTGQHRTGRHRTGQMGRPALTRPALTRPAR